MIFVTLGSQKFQFNRLLKEIDRLIEENEINEEVFAQIGYSDYRPKNYNFREFLDRDEFNEVMSRCDKVITHGGTGAIINGLKEGKRVIAVPRLKVFNEHVDNHQIEITSIFYQKKYIEYSENIDDLAFLISKSNVEGYERYTSNTQTILKEIERFIENI